MTLPPAGELVDLVRRDGPAVLDVFAPDIDRLADSAELAAWLGIRPRTIYRERTRPRAGGLVWPPPDRVIGRSPAWTYRSVVTYRAAMPGRGNREPR